MRDIKEFVKWLAAGRDTTPAAMTIVQAVTGIDLNVAPAAPTEPFDFASCVLLVEDHDLSSELCEVAALSMPWWRVVSNWDRLVALLDAEADWRNGEHIEATGAQAVFDTLNLRTRRKKTILLDMDGPLTNFNEHVFELGAVHGWEFDIETYADAHTYYVTQHISDTAQRDHAREIINTPGFFRTLPVTPGAVEGVESILEAGHEIWVVTKPLDTNPTCRDDKHGWLVEHFPMLAERMITTPDKSPIIGDLLLDDALVHTQVAAAMWEPVVFRTPFNGPGTEWGRYPNWGWGDPAGRLSS